MSSPIQVTRTDPIYFNVSLEEFNLDYCLDSAQCFSWNRINFNGGLAWKGVLNESEVVVRQLPDALQVYGDATAGNIARFFSLDSREFRFADVIKSLVIESENDEVLVTALNAFPGLRILRQPAWETIACFISSQNSNVAMIRERVNLLAAKFGNRVGNSYIFPSPSIVASASLSDLLTCKMGYRAPFLKEAAELITRGDFDISELQRMSFEKARQALLELPGVGPKVADCVCLFGLGHLNSFPVDTHVFQVLNEFYNAELRNLQGDKRSLSYDDLASFGSRKFGAYCGYGQQYLFHLHRVAKHKLENIYQ